MNAERFLRLGPMIDGVARRLGILPHLVLVRDAERCLESGELGRARTLLERARVVAPGAAEPLYLLGRVARASQDRNAEETAYREALALDPGHRGAAEGALAVRAWRYAPVMEAWQRYHAGNFVEAIARFRVALGELGGRIPEECRAEIQSGIGWSALALADPVAAKAAFDAALAAAPQFVAALQGAGIAAYRLGDGVEAEATFARLLSASPGHAEAWSWSGWCAYAREDYGEAQSRFSRAIAENPCLADPVFGRAWTAVRTGDVASANADFRRALDLFAGHPSRHDLRSLVLRDERYADLGPVLARALSAARLPAEALEVLESLPRRCVDRGEGRVLAAATQVALRNYREAAALLEGLPEDDLELGVPEARVTGDGRILSARVSARELRARVELALGSTATARSLLEQVLERDATAVVARVDLAEACLWLGDLPSAEAALDAVRGVEVVHERVVRLRREIARRRRAPFVAALEAMLAGAPRRALEVLDRADAVTPPSDWRSPYLRARALAAEGDPEAAVSVLRPVCAAREGITAPLVLMATLLGKLGRPREGLDLLRSAGGKDVDPDVLAAMAELAERSGSPRVAGRLRRRLSRELGAPALSPEDQP